MGCDIHSKCEVKKDGQWLLNTENVFKNQFEWRIKEDGEFTPHPSDCRNYDWFAILADVRNGSGFAGIKTGEGFVPIADPKGVPEDATPEWKQYVEEWGGDIHSLSYLSVTDFDNYDWDRHTEKCGVIPLEEYKKLKKSGKSPQSWSGGISGPKIVTIPMAKADELLNGKTIKHTEKEMFSPDEHYTIAPDTDLRVHVMYTWKVYYKDWFKNKLKEYVEPMRKLKKNYEDVRLVFGFDN